jgi:hypothetical protein
MGNATSSIVEILTQKIKDSVVVIGVQDTGKTQTTMADLKNDTIMKIEAPLKLNFDNFFDNKTGQERRRDKRKSQKVKYKIKKL